MTEIIPIFPLGLVVFPGEKLNLHVFESRYKDLITESIQTGINFGIPSFIDNELKAFGTEVELYKIDRIYKDGEMDICTKGLRVFRIIKLYKKYNEKLYSFAEIEWVKQVDNGDSQLKKEALKLLNELYNALKVEKEIPKLEEFMVYNIAHSVGFNLQQEYELLQFTNELDRQRLLLTHLSQVLPFAKEKDNLKARIQMNGHFKNISPPEF